MVGTEVVTEETEDPVTLRPTEAEEVEMHQLASLHPLLTAHLAPGVAVAATHLIMMVHQVIHHAVAEDVAEVVTTEILTGTVIQHPPPSMHEALRGFLHYLHMPNPKHVFHYIIEEEICSSQYEGLPSVYLIINFPINTHHTTTTLDFFHLTSTTTHHYYTCN